MSNWLTELYARIFSKMKPLPSGVFHYQPSPEEENSARLHLRLENDGNGILIINASTVLHLNQTAAEYAYYLVNNTPEEDALKEIVRRYHIDAITARQDYESFKANIFELISTPDLDPVTFLGFDRQIPHSGNLSAPLRMDCAITYATRDRNLEAAPQDRVEKELTTDEWKNILQKAWDAGVPHVIFTGGEPTLRDDLPDLIEFSESLGQVTGVLTDGHRFSDPDYLDLLLNSGLDHLMITLDPESDAAWDSLLKTIAADIYVTVHLTIQAEAEQNTRKTLEELSKAGVLSVSLSSSEPEAEPVLKKAHTWAANLGMTLVWDLPVPYSAHHPVSKELEENEEFISGAGRTWLYVEPDGDVMPGQGIVKVLGNLSNESFNAIWLEAQKD